MLRRIIKIIPNTITCGNLLSGCLAVIMAFNLGHEFWGISALHWFYICIGAAAIFDFCDGLSARLLKAYSPMGKELDSLSDLISFGVAPGMLMLNILQQETGQLSYGLIALLIPLFGGLRLAKFNVDDSQATTFRGLPIPANAIFWVGFSAWIEAHACPNVWYTAAIIAVIAGAMVWPMSMFSLKFKNLHPLDNIKRYAILIAAIVFVVLYGISGFAWTILLYMLISAFSRNNDE